MTHRSIETQAERPRERLLAHGAHVLTSPELLAIALRTGVKGCDAVSLGRGLIERFNGLRALLSADAQTLLALPGLGVAKTCELQIGRESCRERVCQYV